MAMYKQTAISLFVFLLYLELAFSQLPSNQVSTMTRLYEIFQNNNGSVFAWNNVAVGSNPCSWTGVSCNSNDSSIIELSFHSFSISTSEFLPVLCQIDTLESLDVSNNELSSIPMAFFVNCGSINALNRLNFSYNRLNGPLPTFNGFRMLASLDFSHNYYLSGEIGLQFDGLDSLRSLNLSHNQFTGNIPTSLGRLNLLEELQLSFNHFTNTIPAQIISYRNLRLVDFSLNKLSGPIPRELGELNRLEILVLSVNNLSSGIPNSLSNITTLFRFAANQNSLNGTIPSGITTYLRLLDLSYNDLIGTIPSDLLSSPNLQSLDLTHNRLEGSIPASISTSLFRLRLGSNSLDGMLSGRSLGSLRNLTYLELDNNNLSGPIPIELGLCRNLALLNLGQNNLTGSLPQELCDLTNLQGLNLQFNNFAGEIPEQISLLNRLQRLNLSRNLFTGPIPSSISYLTNLTNMDLQGNNLTGQIPDTIGSLDSLIELQLGNNQLSGIVPRMPQNLQIALDLSHNNFTGPIPYTLSRLSELEILDLSNNQFWGNIPIFLTTMTSLSQLILSNNQLSGVVPTFRSQHVFVDYTGNPGLISPVENPNPASRQGRRSLASVVIIAFATAAIAVGLMFMIVLFISRKYYRINDEHLHFGEELSLPEVIFRKFLTPNSIHRSNIDFIKAMEAVTNPLNVILKTRFSTYYKSVMPSGASYFVKKLNWSDKIFQLGNHERFGEELEVLGKVNNSNVMIPLAYILTADSAFLVYDFTPKGTLYDVLHGSMVNTLDWANRYSIALGVAQGLAFLHGYNYGSILLLDLSSKIIMLKSLNEPLVGDIELFKVIDPSKRTGSLSTVAGSVGYIPPEYAYTMRVTAAGNVYSFGVILLELLTGKTAVSGGIELAKWVLSNSVLESRRGQILDYRVSNTSVSVRRQMLAVLKVALTCVSIPPDSRPKMKSVLRMLLNAS